MSATLVRWGRGATALAVLLLPAAGVLFYGWYKLFHEVPQEYVSDEWNFKYGTIGTEEEQGVPYWVWLVLPGMCPESRRGRGGYAPLGLPYEPGEELPVGFSKKTIGFPRVGINCAACHTATVRGKEEETPRLYLAAPAQKLDVQRYLKFL